MIDIIYRIFDDIGYFIVVLLVMVFSFAYSFYIISKSQEEFDGLTEKEEIPYNTLYDSIYYMWELTMGNANSAPYAFGDASQQTILMILYLLAVFIFSLHLMNMLIAIMGNTYALRNEVVNEVKYADHLSFVIDNWFLLPLAFKDISKLKYIVAGVPVVHSEDGEEQFSQIKDDISQLKDIVLGNQDISQRSL